MRRFNGDQRVVGQTVRVNNVPLTIVGVAAEGFRGLSVTSPDAWIPLGMVSAL